MTEETQALAEASEFTEIAPGPLTTEDAYVRLQNVKAEIEETPETTDEPITEETTTDSTDDISWSNQELGVLGTIQQRTIQVQQAVQQHLAAEAAFKEQYAGVNLNELEKTDRARAVQIRSDARDLQENAKNILAHVNDVNQARAQVQEAVKSKHVDKARSRLLTKAPRLSDDAHAMEFQQHLLNAKGYTVADIANCVDHRPVLAEYLVWTSEQPEVRKVPKYRNGKKPTKQQPKADPEFTAALERVRDGGGLRENATAILRGSQRTSTKQSGTVTQLKQRLRQSGSVDDAYELIQAQKRQRQSA